MLRTARGFPCAHRKSAMKARLPGPSTRSVWPLVPAISASVRLVDESQQMRPVHWCQQPNGKPEAQHPRCGQLSSMPHRSDEGILGQEIGNVSPPMDNRDLAVWAMPAVTERGVSEVASIWFPRNNQRRQAEKVLAVPKKPIHFFAPAPPDMAVRIRLLERRELVPAVLPKSLGQPIGNFEFDDGRNITLTIGFESFNSALLELVRQGKGHGTIFNKESEPQPGQKIDDLSAIVWTEPTDGCAIHLAELHGFNLRRR